MRWGAKTYVINNEPDGTNINTNCGSTHIEGLQKFVKEKGLDVGFAYDGDADRCIAVDENGEVDVYENMTQNGHCLGGEAVRTYHFQQTCDNR